MLVLLIIIFIVVWGTFALVQLAIGGCPLVGECREENHGEGLNFKVPFAERVIKVDVKVQPIRSRRSMPLQKNTSW